MIKIDEMEPWEQPLFAENVPVEIILRIAHMILDHEELRSLNESTQDLTIYRMLALTVFQRGADYREVPWTLRLEHVRLTGQGEQRRPTRPEGTGEPFL